MKSFVLSLAIGTASLSFSAAPALFAADNPSTTQTSLSSGDKSFVTKAGQAGNSEVLAGQLAAKKSSNDDVKMFAEHMVKDHTDVGKELQDLASSKGLQLGSDTGKSGSKELDKLTKAEGADFDKLYIDGQVADHEAVVKMFEKAAKKSDDADVQKFASDHVEALKGHLQMAKDLQAKLNPTAVNK